MFYASDSRAGRRNGELEIVEKNVSAVASQVRAGGGPPESPMTLHVSLPWTRSLSNEMIRRLSHAESYSETSERLRRESEMRERGAKDRRKNFKIASVRPPPLFLAHSSHRVRCLRPRPQDRPTSTHAQQFAQTRRPTTQVARSIGMTEEQSNSTGGGGGGEGSAASKKARRGRRQDNTLPPSVSFSVSVSSRGKRASERASEHDSRARSQLTIVPPFRFSAFEGRPTSVQGEEGSSLDVSRDDSRVAAGRVSPSSRIATMPRS